jgi:CHAD domain-containing protein
MAHASSLIDVHLQAVRRSLQRLAAHSAPEEVHKARVAIRRLRTILVDVAPAIDAPRGDQLREDLRRMARELGWVRDADIRAEVLLPALRRIDAEAGVAANRAARTLEKKLQAARRESRRRLRAYLRALPEPTAYLQDDELLAGGRSAETAAILEGLLDRALQRRWKKMLKALQRNPASAARRHALRIRVKKCRYLLDARRTRKPPHQLAEALRLLRRLQDRLGSLNDLAQVRRWLRLQGLDPALSRLLKVELRARRKHETQGLERQRRRFLRLAQNVRV